MSDMVFYSIKVPVLMVLIEIILLPSFWSSVYASPEFSRHEIKDGIGDSITQNGTASHFYSGQASIKSVNYYSDGNFLNSTLWLIGKITNESSGNNNNSNQTVGYGMYIDADSRGDTGWPQGEGVDYQVEVSRINGTWTRTVVEWSSSGDTKIIEELKNYTGFFKDEQSYVTLYADLKSMGSPEKYRLSFYAQQGTVGTSDWQIDYTNWVHIPPPDFVVSTNPSSIVLRPGEEASIEVELKSTSAFEPVVLLSPSYGQRNETDIQTAMDSDRISVPAFGTSTTRIDIKVSDTARTGTHSLVLYANATFPDSGPGFIDRNLLPAQQEGFDMVIGIPAKNEVVPKDARILITVSESLSIDQIVSDFWSSWGSPLTFVIGVITGKANWILSSVKKFKVR